MNAIKPTGYARNVNLMNKRSIYKAISWEGLSNAVVFIMAYAIFGNIGECAAFVLACVALKIVGYYYHERWWND